MSARGHAVLIASGRHDASMKDRCESLQACGIAAVQFNSALDAQALHQAEPDGWPLAAAL